MTHAFIVSLDVDSTDPVSLANTAEDIRSDLEANYEVVDVKPWSPHNNTPTQPPTQL